MQISQSKYLERKPENLVLEGYRQWCLGIRTGDFNHWQYVWNRYAVEFGSGDGKFALDALRTFIKTLGNCAQCPLKNNPVGCAAVCLDEVFVLGLISGILHDDQEAVSLCIDGLICREHYYEVFHSAEILATVLRSLDEVLLPIPARTIEAIVLQQAHDKTFH